MNNRTQILKMVSFKKKLVLFLIIHLSSIVLQPCVLAFIDKSFLEEDAVVDKKIEINIGSVYTSYSLSEDFEIHKDLYINNNTIASNISDFCCDDNLIYFGSEGSLYSYNIQSKILNLIADNLFLREIALYNNCLYGIDENRFEQLVVVNLSNDEVIRTNYTNVNSYKVSDDGLEIDMRVSNNYIDIFENNTLSISAQDAIHDADKIEKADDGIDHLIAMQNTSQDISLFSANDSSNVELNAIILMSSIQPAMFVMDTLYVTQGAYSSYSHSDDNAFDLDGSLGGGTYDCASVYAPFDGTVKYKETSYNAVWVESNNIVQYANGSTGYMTVLFMHDMDISDIYVGQRLTQKQAFYNEGGKGPNGITQYGTHLHIECMSGQVGSKGWSARGNVYPNDALYLYSTTNISNKGGYTWRTWSDTKPTRATLTINKESFKIGEEFTITSSSDTASQYYLAIFSDDTGEQIIGENVSATYKNSFQRAGKYNAHMSAYNSKGSVDSNWISFYVYGSPPTKAELSADKTELNIGEKVTLTTWTNAYYVRIYGSIHKNNKTVYEGYIPYTFSYTPTEAGEYSMHVSAFTHEGSVDSNWVTFYVGKYNITYDANGGTGAPSSQTKVHGKNLKLSTVKPTREGYTFKCWNTKANGSGTSYDLGGSYTSNSSVTLYAQWDTSVQTIYFDANEGSTVISNKTVTYNASYGELPIPVRKGYKFIGWFTERDGGTQVTAGTKVTITANQTLYAHWEHEPITEPTPERDFIFDDFTTKLDASWGDDEFFFGFYYKANFETVGCGLRCWDAETRKEIEYSDPQYREYHVDADKYGVYSGCHAGFYGPPFTAYGLIMGKRYEWVGYIKDTDGNVYESETYTFTFTPEGSKFLKVIQPLENYSDDIIVETGTSDGKTCFVITAVDDMELSGMCMYVAEYTEDGKLISINEGESVYGENVKVMTADAPKSNNFKIFIWDTNMKPIIKTITTF